VSRSRERTRFLTSYRSCAVRTADYRAGRLSACFAVPVAREQDGIFTLRGRVAWAHDFNPDRNIGATFQTLPGVSFVVNGAAQASDLKKWLNGWSAAATFEGEFSSVTTSYAGKGVVRYAW
jgi:hypothetical protein